MLDRKRVLRVNAVPIEPVVPRIDCTPQDNAPASITPSAIAVQPTSPGICQNMAFIREDVTGTVSVGHGAADLWRAAKLVRRFIFFYFVCIVSQRFRRDTEASWTVLSYASKLQVAESNEQQCQSAFGGSDRSRPAPTDSRGSKSLRPLYDAQASKLNEKPNEDSAPENILEANEAAQWEPPTVAALPASPSHTAAFDNAESTPLDVEKRNWVRKSTFDADNSDRERPGDGQSLGLLRRQLSKIIRTPVDLPIGSPSVSLGPERLHKRSKFVRVLQGTMRHGQNPVSTKERLHRNTVTSTPPFSKPWRSYQNNPSRIATALQLNESWQNTTSQSLGDDRPTRSQTFQGRLLQTIDLFCRTLPGLPLQDTARFREACSFLCQTACADAAGQRRSTSTQRSAFGAVQFKLQKAILNFVRVSASQQPQLLQQACQNASQQFRQRRGIERVLPFGGSTPDPYSGAAFASSSMTSMTSSASSTQVLSAGDDQDMHLLPVEASQSVSLPLLSTSASGSRDAVTPVGGLSTAAATAAPINNEFDSSSTSSTVGTGHLPPSPKSFDGESGNFPPTEAVATDAPAELLFSPELLGDTELSETSSAPRSLTGIAEGLTARQHPKTDGKADAFLPMQRNLQQGLFWQQFIPSGISFDSNVPRTRFSGNLETMPTSVLFPRTRISWSTADSAHDGLRRPVGAGQLRYALASSGERERRRNGPHQRRGVDRSEKQSPDQLTTPELEDIRVQLTGVLYEVLQQLIENPTEVGSEFEKEKRKQRGPALKAHGVHGQERGGTQTNSKDSKSPMLVDGNGENTISASFGT